MEVQYLLLIHTRIHTDAHMCRRDELVIFCLAAIRSVKLQKLNQRDIQDLNSLQVYISSLQLVILLGN